MKSFSNILFLLFFSGLSTQAQSLSNLESIYNLIGKSTEAIAAELDSGKEYNIEYHSPEEYLILKNIVLDKLKERTGAGFIEKDNGNRLNYTVSEAGVRYEDIFRKGFLGSFYAERKVFLSGSYSLSAENKIIDTGEFYYSGKDTVKNSSLASLESSALPFTKSERPTEPFFSSLLEPAVAIGTAAITIFLFFSVRSK